MNWRASKMECQITGTAYCNIKKGHCKQYAILAEQNEKMLAGIRTIKQLILQSGTGGQIYDTANALITEIEEGA
jgi:hypothetical protein